VLSDKTQFVRQVHTLLFAGAKKIRPFGRVASLRDLFADESAEDVLLRGKVKA
jgi:hypothetical protein